MQPGPSAVSSSAPDLRRPDDPQDSSRSEDELSGSEDGVALLRWILEMQLSSVSGLGLVRALWSVQEPLLLQCAGPFRSRSLFSGWAALVGTMF